MSLILVVDDMTILREPIAASLRSAGHETICAQDGQEALDLTRLRHPHLILLDVAMPKMDGIAFLRHLRRDISTNGTKVILLTAISERKYILAAAPFGIKDYILKSKFRLTDLLERINRALSPASLVGAAEADSRSTLEKTRTRSTTPTAGQSLPAMLTREHVLQRVEKVLQAKSLAGVIGQVIAFANSPRGDTAQLAAMISRDPMLSARVLQAANSAAYAAAGPPVTNLRDAIRKIGCNAVRNIASAIGVLDCIPDTGAHGFNPFRYWQHSFAVAQLCEKFAADIPEHAGLAYVVGLCHDLGDIFIRSQFHAEYQQVIDTATQSGRRRHDIMRETWGITHAEIIGAVLRCMSLPDQIREPIEHVHSANPLRSTNPLAAILWMAEHFANGAMLAAGTDACVVPVTQLQCRSASLDPGSIRPEAGKLRNEVLTMTLTLAKLSAADQVKLLVPLFAARHATIWVSRGRGMIDVDPITLCLQSLANVVAAGRLPLESEIQEMDGLVVISPDHQTSEFSPEEIESLVAKANTEKPLPLLTFSSNSSRRTDRNDLSWRSQISLAELAGFVEGSTMPEVDNAKS